MESEAVMIITIMVVKVSIPFKREGAWKEIQKHRSKYPAAFCFNSLQTGRSMERRRIVLILFSSLSQFQFPSNGKEHGKPLFCTHRFSLRFSVSIPFKREGAWKETLFSTQTGRGSVTPKTKHELRRDLFARKITPKIPQTLVAIEPNAIFQQKRLETQARSMFVGNLKLSHTRSQNRVCFYKYTQNSHISQIFFTIFSKRNLRKKI